MVILNLMHPFDTCAYVLPDNEAEFALHRIMDTSNMRDSISKLLS
jgi:hypothetical protein